MLVHCLLVPSIYRFVDSENPPGNALSDIDGIYLPTSMTVVLTECIDWSVL